MTIAALLATAFIAYRFGKARGYRHGVATVVCAANEAIRANETRSAAILRAQSHQSGVMVAADVDAQRRAAREGRQ